VDRRLKNIAALLVVLMVVAYFLVTRDTAEEHSAPPLEAAQADSLPVPRTQGALPPIPVSTERIAASLLARLEALSPEDQRGLDELFREWGELASANGEHYSRLLSSFIQRIEKLPTARAFFLVQAMTRPGVESTKHVGELLDRRPESSAPSQAHEVSEKDRLDMIQSYALERTAGQSRFILDDLRSHPLVRRVAEMARENSNLLVVRESLQWLLKSVEGAAGPVREIILARGPGERHAVGDLLGE